MAGLKVALRQYGLDPVEAHVGIATRASNTSPGSRLSQNLARNCQYRDQLTREGAFVLEGLLVDRRTGLEEKQVDVLCAIAVADLADRISRGFAAAKCIVVLSEDMDLIPAYEFAQARGVKVYATAYDTVHVRPTTCGWILLHEEALGHLCNPPGRKTGTELRKTLARIAMSPAAPPATWKVVAPRIDDGRVLLTNNLGANGMLISSRHLKKGEQVELFTCAIEVDPHSGRFPYLRLAEKPSSSGPCPGVSKWVVLYWTAPTTIRARQCDSRTEATLHAAPGSLLPGQTIAVLEGTVDGNFARHLIGPLDQTAMPGGWSHSRSTARARVISRGQGAEAWAVGKLIDTGDTVRIHRQHLTKVADGSTVVVALVGQAPDSVTPLTMPLSTGLN